MAGSPYIKSEPNDFNFNPNQFSAAQQGAPFNMGSYNNNMNGTGQNVDPSHLARGGNFSQNFGSQNMSSSFLMGNAGIADDELADLAGSLDNAQAHGGFQQGQQAYGDNSAMNQQQQQQQHYFNAGNNMSGSRIPLQHNQSQIYSHTPEGAPIQSPFVNGFNYNNFRPDSSQQQQGFNMSSSGNFANSLMRQQHMANMERKISESRSPASPNTPGINGLHIGEPQFPTSGLQQALMNQRHSASLSHNWDSTPSGGHSWNESSPFASPANGHQMHHAQISEVLGVDGNKIGSSLPTKMEPGVGQPHMQTQEAKKRRRRESHNLVERRRRDNINERIHDLANLVPQHRLEDEKVRKHLQTNSPLSPSITAQNMSPPQSSSLLASSAGRRAAGNVTQGLPIEDKDKGPNKGDILNSSVAWSRDVMWYMNLKMQQEAQLQELISGLGGVWPFEQSEDEKRMRSEIDEVCQRNIGANNLQPYSRTNGSGLRVPGFTSVAGDALQPGDPGYGSSGPDMSPAYGQNFNFSNGLKEEDEFDEDML